MAFTGARSRFLNWDDARSTRHARYADERSGAELLRCDHLTSDSNLEPQGNATAGTKRPTSVAL
jgi:hypothetical protein